MTEREARQQQEIERLQKKVRSLTEAYSQTAKELQELKAGMVSRRRGRPGLEDSQKARILFLYQQGKSMRQVAEETGTVASTVHKVIAQAVARTRVVYLYMDREEPATLIDACSATRRIKIVNLTDDLISRAFGVRTEPTWEDYEEFLGSRCMPRTRYGVREELRYMGLDLYDPTCIIEKTAGRVHGDHQWLWKMDGCWIKDYDMAASQIKDEEELKCRLKDLLMVWEGQEVRDGTSGGAAKDSRGDRGRLLQGKPE